MFAQREHDRTYDCTPAPDTPTPRVSKKVSHVLPLPASPKALNSEFKRHFVKRLSDHEVVHCKTYPKTLRM